MLLAFPSIPGILQNIPSVTSSPSISGAIFDVTEDLDETCENPLPYSHRPIEFKVIESEQFSLCYRSLKLDENLRGEWGKEGFWFWRETGNRSRRNASTLHSLQTALPWVENEGKKNTPMESKSGQEIKITNRDWNFHRQPSMFLLFMFCSRKRGIPRNSTNTAVNSIFHSCKTRPMAYSAIYEILTKHEIRSIHVRRTWLPSNL